jgi:hypothetical protein
MLDGFAGRAGYEVSADLYRLVSVEIHEDSLTFQYRGAAHVGDSAWVVRFSAKSSEQSPEMLADVVRIFAVLGEARENLALIEEGTAAVGEATARFLRYRFDSPVRDNQSRPFPAHGIVATLSREENGELVVYHFKLDNHGDRDTVQWADLQPFLDPLHEA